MCDDVDSMTNAELQSKLTEYGYPKVPVTPATRKVLVKKLKSLLDKEKPSTVKDSKDEDKAQPSASSIKNQGGNTPVKQKERNRRRTSVAPTHDVAEDKEETSIIEDAKVTPSAVNKVEEMSDDDLRTKLTEHGYPLMPVTAATRGLLEKKLKSILYGKTKDATDSKERHSIVDESKTEETKIKTRRSRYTIASTEESKINAEKKLPIVVESKIEDPRTKTKRSRNTIASEDVLNIDSTYERPQKISRVSEQSSTFTSSSVVKPFETLSSNRSTFGTNSPLGSQTARRKYDFNISSSLLDSHATDRVEYPIRKPSPNRLDLSNIVEAEQSATERKSQSFFDKINSFSRLSSISSLSKTSAPSSYIPNTNFSSNQSSTFESDDSDSPFLSEFGRRLHAEKLRAKNNSN